MTNIALLNQDLPDFLQTAGVSDLTKQLAGKTGIKRIVPKNGIFRKVVGGEEMGKVKGALNAVIVRLPSARLCQKCVQLAFALERRQALQPELGLEPLTDALAQLGRKLRQLGVLLEELLQPYGVFARGLDNNVYVQVGLVTLIFGLVLMAMGLAVTFATRGAMAGNREIVDVLHFVGAEDRFIGVIDLVKMKAITYKTETMGADYDVSEIPADMQAEADCFVNSVGGTPYFLAATQEYGVGTPTALDPVQTVIGYVPTSLAGPFVDNAIVPARALFDFSVTTGERIRSYMRAGVSLTSGLFIGRALLISGEPPASRPRRASARARRGAECRRRSRPAAAGRRCPAGCARPSRSSRRPPRRR